MSYCYLNRPNWDYYNVRQVRGANELEIYKNFLKDYPRGLAEMILDRFIEEHDVLLDTKDDKESLFLRETANELYQSIDCDTLECIKIYSKSLRHATYNGENYAKALANRSLMLFKNFEFKKCIQDIDLCLQAKYPKHLKPKIFLRKCECYSKLGICDKLIETVDDFLLYLNNENFRQRAIDEYKKQISRFFSKEQVLRQLEFSNETKLPIIERNKAFTDASVDVELRRDQNDSFYACSSKKIEKGRVLFVEKAYVFSPCNVQHLHCQYCLKKILNGVPCKTCIQFMYCTEACRDLAWSEFHQWECYAIRAKLFNDTAKTQLALRIVLKTYLQEFQTPPLKENIPLDKFSTIYHLPKTFHNKLLLQMHTENAMLYVHYLKKKTNFFEHLQSSFSNKSETDLMTTIGGLLIRYSIQIQSKGLSIYEADNLPDLDYITAVAVYPSMSQMSHSCDPNTTCYFQEDVVIVKAITDIDSNTRLTFSYSNFDYRVLNLAERKKRLWDILHLKCNCAPCLNPLLNLEAKDSFICVSCGGPSIMNDDNIHYKCLACENIFEMPLEIKLKIDLTMMSLNILNISKDINLAKSILATAKTFLSPYHRLFKDVYLIMLRWYIDNGINVTTLEFFKESCDYFEVRDGVYSMGNALTQAGYCDIVLKWLIDNKSFISACTFRNGMNYVEKLLKKAIELNELFLPPQLEKIRETQMKYLQLKFELLL